MASLLTGGFALIIRVFLFGLFGAFSGAGGLALATVSPDGAVACFDANVLSGILAEKITGLGLLVVGGGGFAATWAWSRIVKRMGGET